MNEKIVQFIRRNGILLVGAAVACAALFFWNIKSDGEQMSQNDMNWAEESSTEINNEEDPEKLMAEPEETAIYKVDVKGAVQKPGVYEFLKGDRVTDVIQKAGGLKNGADSKQVNMAQLVEDEMVIYIPIKGEEVEVSNQTNGESSGDAVSSKGDGIININKATSEELQELPGIGPSKATAILQKREELGSFKTIEDLKEVTGIGDKTFEKLRELITVK